MTSRPAAPFRTRPRSCRCRGLALDRTRVTWNADLRLTDASATHGWGVHDFRGSRWTNVKSADNQRYLLNAYRVLLTRARQGMVIFVPPAMAAT